MNELSENGANEKHPINCIWQCTNIIKYSSFIWYEYGARVCVCRERNTMQRDLFAVFTFGQAGKSRCTTKAIHNNYYDYYYYAVVAAA